MATLILRDDSDLDPAGFEAFLADQADLSPEAWPRYVRLATEVPTTATNKVLKRALRTQGVDVDDPLWERSERGRSYTALRHGRAATSSGTEVSA
jgi:fatty-acyl-CoA synthase